ncbi:hypothetical protein EJD97_011590 [Solanum chilense]|uniref:Uncharacterized protein n=1 Tax=Solanum chilense TaxID=4083 RepID=A0A6N2AG27_SOLCI|nr:hypothetical protein EJD97_011590 [Solanum chilense]
MTKLYKTEIPFIIIVLPNTILNIQLMSRYYKFISSIYKRMGINCTDYNLIIVGKCPTSFISQGQVNFEE